MADLRGPITDVAASSGGCRARDRPAGRRDTIVMHACVCAWEGTSRKDSQLPSWAERARACGMQLVR